MEQKDLQELQEITGLVSEELNSNKQNSNNTELSRYVGAFVKAGKAYGMIDNVHGDRLGFVWSEKDSWTGELVDLEECEILTNKADIDNAMASAVTYFKREHDSLTMRMARKYSTDNQQTLAKMLWFVDEWLEKLTA